MSDFKYIVFEVKISGVNKKMPVIFADDIVHAVMAKAVTRAMEMQRLVVTPVSAGFVRFHDTNTFGGSETLDMSANPEDAKLIEYYPTLHGIDDGGFGIALIEKALRDKG